MRASLPARRGGGRQGGQRGPPLPARMLGSVTGAKTNRRRDKRRLKASLDFALLGLIAEQRAISGYDLLKIFNLSMVHFWHAHHAQIYSTLDRLEGQGLIRGRELVQHGKPNKGPYSITPARCPP